MPESDATSQQEFRPTNPALQEREYGVFLARGEERRFESVVAWSKARAADMCRIRCGESWEPIAVTISDRFDIAGRCERCGVVLFADDRPQQTAAGVLCADC